MEKTKGFLSDYNFSAYLPYNVVAETQGNIKLQVNCVQKMIHYGDWIFDLNTSGVLGSGIGAAFEQEHPLTRKRPEDDGLSHVGEEGRMIGEEWTRELLVVFFKSEEGLDKTLLSGREK